MKTLLTLIVMSAIFLGGYHLGRKPDSPDLIGSLKKSYVKVVEAGKAMDKLARTVQDRQTESAEPQQAPASDRPVRAKANPKPAEVPLVALDYQAMAAK